MRLVDRGRWREALGVKLAPYLTCEASLTLRVMEVKSREYNQYKEMTKIMKIPTSPTRSA